MVTPSDLTQFDTAKRLPATSIVWMLATAQNWCDMPRMTTSDLSAFSCSPFHKNHRVMADEQSTKRLTAGMASQVFIAMNVCRRQTGDRKFRTTWWVYWLVHDVICCLAFMGIQYAPFIACQSVLFPSPHASSQRTHQLLPSLLISRLIELQTKAASDETQNGSCRVICERASGCTGGGQAVSPTRCAFLWDQMTLHLDDYCCSVE